MCGGRPCCRLPNTRCMRARWTPSLTLYQGGSDSWETYHTFPRPPYGSHFTSTKWQPLWFRSVSKDSELASPVEIFRDTFASANSISSFVNTDNGASTRGRAVASPEACCSSRQLRPSPAIEAWPASRYSSTACRLCSRSGGSRSSEGEGACSPFGRQPCRCSGCIQPAGRRRGVGRSHEEEPQRTQGC